MATPKEVLWELDPPTVGKHIVLKEYLKAWLPILGMHGDRLVFIDAFAGPGKYKGAEDGSPIIALKTAAAHSAVHRFRDLRFLFVEEDVDRAKHLEGEIAKLRGTLPANVNASVHAGSFAEVVGGLLASLRAEGRSLAPTLLMIDPFGVKGVPLTVLEEFLRHPRTELLISFMAESMRRFATTDEFEPHLDLLYGNADWRACRTDGKKMEALFEETLRNVGAKYVLRFRVKDGDRHIYTLFFATKHPLGCDKMKQAMWKAAPDGSFHYEPSAAAMANYQLQFFDLDQQSMMKTILTTFADHGALSIEDVLEWARGDQTLHHSGQVKSALRQLEKLGRLRVLDAPPKRRRGDFPDGTLFEVLAS